MTEQQTKSPTWLIDRLDSTELHGPGGELEGYSLIDKTADPPLPLTPVRPSRSSAWADAHQVRYVPGEGVRYVPPGPDRSADIVRSDLTGEPVDEFEDWTCRHCGVLLVTGYDGRSDQRFAHVYEDRDPRFLHSGSSECVFLIGQSAVRDVIKVMNDAKVKITPGNVGAKVQRVHKALVKAGYLELAGELTGRLVRLGPSDAEKVATVMREKIAALTLVVFRDYREDEEGKP